MFVSIVLPSRGEYHILRRFLDSIERTTKHKHAIEVLIALDEGETEVPEHLYKRDYSFSLQFFKRPQTDNFSDDYYNWLTNKSTGENVWPMNDDVTFVTQDWDVKLRKKIDEYRWSVYLVDTKETTRGKVNKDFCCFPIISKEGVNSIGYLFNPQVRIYPADKIVYQTYDKAGRVIPAHNIVVHNVYVPEERNERFKRIFQEDIANGRLTIDITRDVFKLVMAGKHDVGPRKETKLRKILNIIKEK